MLFLLTFLLICNLLIGFCLFRAIYRRRKLIQDRFATVMTATSSSAISLTVSMVIYFLFPAEIAVVSSVTTANGACIGIAFGSLVKFQSLLSGCFHGMTGGIMGAILGAVVLDPSICALPLTTARLDQMMLLFSIFGTGIVLVTSFLVYYALRV